MLFHINSGFKSFFKLWIHFIKWIYNTKTEKNRVFIGGYLSPPLPVFPLRARTDMLGPHLVLFFTPLQFYNGSAVVLLCYRMASFWARIRARRIGLKPLRHEACWRKNQHQWLTGTTKGRTWNHQNGPERKLRWFILIGCGIWLSRRQESAGITWERVLTKYESRAFNGGPTAQAKRGPETWRSLRHECVHRCPCGTEKHGRESDNEVEKERTELEELWK